MILKLLILSQALALPKFSSKFKDSLGGMLGSPAQQEYNAQCKPTLDKLVALEGSVGPVSKENLSSYEQARLNLHTILGICANLDTSSDTSLMATQKSAVEKMYNSFIARHLVMDQYGQTGGFDPTSQNLFTPESPLVEEHYICQPETMGKADELIGKSWLTRDLASLEETIKNKTPLVQFENQVAGDYDKFVAIAKEKSQACLGNKLEEIRPYTNAAPASIIKEWEGTVRLEFSNHTDLDISRIVFPHSQFKRITETTREYDNGTIREFRQDYDVMDTYVYVVNGEFVDAYLVSLYKDYVKNEEYARFYGKDASGKLRVSQRLLLKNF